MTVEPLTTEQIAAMLPDQLREYGATLAGAVNHWTAEVANELGGVTDAKVTLLQAEQRLKQAQVKLKGYEKQASMIQSLLRSMPVI